MVLCKFFQQGSCRFGSKCVNEHFDVKQVIKTDVEAAINGKQWPLSTYGPFKDKPSIPNFIEDQSFEEVRMLCYEAKQKNFFEQFHQQFNKEALEATNKMKALLQLTPEIIEVAINVYDTPSDTSSSGVTGGKSANNTNNPFAAATNAGSIFAKSNTNNNNNLFGNSGNSTFGGTNQGTSNSIFGNSSTFDPPQQQQTSIFAQASKPANSIFGGGNNNMNNQQNTSIFGQQQNQPNVFATSAQPQQQPTSAGIFSQQIQFPQQQTQQNSNIFRQASQTTQSPQGIFAQAAQSMQTQQQTQQQGLFNQAAQQTTATGQSIFAQAVQQTQNIFGQTLQQQQQQQTANTNIFQQNPANTQQQLQSNMFQQNQPIALQQQAPNQQPPPSGLFQQAALQTQNAAGQMNQQIGSTLYSRLEDLTPDEIEAFKADCFLPGKIPFNPPPRELIH